MANENVNISAQNNNNNNVVEIDLVYLLNRMLKRWWLILLVSLLTATAAGAYTVTLVTPMYESQAMIFVLSSTTSITSLTDIQIGTTLTSDFVVIATSKPVLDAVIEDVKTNMGVTLTRDEVSSMVSVTNNSDTRILTFTATADDPTVACEVARAIANQTAEAIAEIMVSDLPTTVEDAEVSTEPVSPSLTKNVLMGFLAGFVVICCILAFRIIMNDNIRSEEDLEKYFGVSTLVSIPKRK